MPSTRSTQPRLVTEPTMKPTLEPPRHSRTPTCTRCIGCWALARANRAASKVMVMHVPTRTALRKPDRLQFDIGDTGSDIQPGLALHADRLQRIGILRPADQKVAAAADPDRCVGADATVIAGEISASNPAGRCVHLPRKPALIGEAA